MASTLEAKELDICQQTKDSVRSMMGRYLAFVGLCLYDEGYIETMENLLPFDHFARAKLILRGEESKIKSLGVSVMRMDFEPSVFSLGISIILYNSSGLCFKSGFNILGRINSFVFKLSCFSL